MSKPYWKAVAKKYKGKTYPTLKALYDALPEPKCSYGAFVGWIRQGVPVDEAIERRSKGTWRKNPVTYKGVKYPSMRQLYLVIQKDYRLKRHYVMECPYTLMVEFINKYGVDEGVAKAYGYKKRVLKDLKASSKKLEGADNLVCQRMTKLGWSYEKAISTPRNTKSLPIPVVYKGKKYSSVTKCFNDVKPDLCYPEFIAFLRKHKFVVK